MTTTLTDHGLGLEFREAIDAVYDDHATESRAFALSEWYASLENDPAKARGAAVFCLDSLWDFISTLAWTVDEKALESEIRLRPMAPLPYVKTFSDFIDEKDEDGFYAHPIAAVVKSRQMMATWVLAFDLVYTAIKLDHSKSVIISSTEDTGCELLIRCAAAYRLLPAWFKEAMGLPSEMKKVFQTTEAKFPNGARIIVRPERGGDSVRSLSPTKVRLDECAFQRDFESSWASVRGSSGDTRRTQVLAVSTASVDVTRFFQELVEDVKDGRKGGPVAWHHKSEGFEVYHTQNFDIDVMRLHYTADPAKRLPGWRSSATKGLKAYQWQMEYELDFEAKSGALIFPMLDAIHHVTKKAISVSRAKDRWHVHVGDGYDSNAALGLGIDHGRRNPCGGLWVAADSENDLFCYRDYCIAGRSATENAEAIGKMCGSEEYAWAVIDAQGPLDDRREGKVEDLYRWKGADRSKPIMPWLRPCKKWAGSVQWGIDQISDMLHATLAVATLNGQCKGHPYWEDHGYSSEAIESFGKGRAIFISPACGDLLRELRVARYKDLANEAVNQPETEVDVDNHVRKPLAYLLAAGMQWRG